MAKKIILILSVLIIFFPLTPRVFPAGKLVFAQQAAPSDSLKEAEEGVPATVGEELKNVPLPAWLAERPLDPDIKRQPLRYFRQWANQGLSPWPAFFFLLSTSLAAWLLLPQSLSRAQALCRSSFWRSLLVGLLTILLSLSFARLLFLSEIGQPLALFTIALVELGLLLGLAAPASAVGEAMLGWLGVLQRLEKRPRLSRFLMVAAGVGIFALLLTIPGIGRLPRIGTRLIVLMAALGLGGLVRLARGLEPAPPS